MATDLALPLKNLQRYPAVLAVCCLSLPLISGLSPHIQYLNKPLAYT